MTQLWEIISSLGVLIPFLLNIAFLTLLERKYLGLSQMRKGPNKVSVGGVLQPIADAVKLFSKEMFCPTFTKKMVYFASPGAFLVLSVILWMNMEFDGRGTSNILSGILFMVVLSLGLYPLMFSGWSSGSAYSLVGSLRGMAQTISYEISMALLLLSVLILRQSLHWEGFMWNHAKSVWLFLPLFTLWVLTCVAESNRTPFDFAEGESELVSGFNVEYGGGGFALIFMAEYGNILSLSAFSCLLFLGVSLNVWLSFGVFFLAVFWVSLRATLPRFRYDLLMSMAWKLVLPMSLSLLVVIVITMN